MLLWPAIWNQVPLQRAREISHASSVFQVQSAFLCLCHSCLSLFTWHGLLLCIAFSLISYTNLPWFGGKSPRGTPGWSHLNNCTALFAKTIISNKVSLTCSGSEDRMRGRMGVEWDILSPVQKDLRMWRTVKQMSFCIRFLRWAFITTQRQCWRQFRPTRCSWYYEAGEHITRFTMGSTLRVLLTGVGGVGWWKREVQRLFWKL